MSQQANRVVVIGAGIGGLVAALELASQGIPVTVIEKSPKAGGKIRELSPAGRGIDSGPTVFTMRQIFEDIFRAAGTELEQHLTLQPVGILARHAWNADEQLDLFADINRSAEAIGEFANANEAQRYLEFCQQAQAIFQTLEHSFMLSSRPSPVELVKRVGPLKLKQLWQLNPFVTLWKALEKSFTDPRLRQLFGRYSTYMGSSPFQAPATLMLIAHVEQAGVWLVQGGMYRLVEAFTRLAENAGVQFIYDTAVSEILVRNQSVAGVQLDNDTQLESSCVVFNGDHAALSKALLGKPASRAVAVQHPAKRSLSAITWSMSVQTNGFPLLRHNVFFSDNYANEFQDIFQRSRLPETPTVYVCAQDRDEHNDRQQLQEERLLCLVNAPAVGDSNRFTEAELDKCKERTFNMLAQCGLEVDYQEDKSIMTTPYEFERLFPATGGALYGRASHGWMASFQRPGSRSRIGGLYLTGGSVHPGAGIPMAAMSGRLAAAAICHDLDLH